MLNLLRKSPPPNPLAIEIVEEKNMLVLKGIVDLSNYTFVLKNIHQALKVLDLNQALSVNGKGIRMMDTSGAWALVQLKRQWESFGGKLYTKDFSEGFDALIHYIDATVVPVSSTPVLKVKSSVLSPFECLGEKVLRFFSKMKALMAFQGEIFLCFGKLLHPAYRIRLASLVTHLEWSGIHALPVVGLISFLIGIVLTFQGAEQLSRFGAQIYTVNLLGISILREVGILLTAIVVAGRSGSAFTAQIGSMKLNQEIDALETMGLQPFAMLVMPRVVALMLVMPLLAFFADVMGILGGALMAYLHLNISFELFFHQLHQSVTPWTFWVGIIKAPVFAFVIGLVGCYEGFAVENKAESIGQHTTWSVVEGITFVIVVDALFSILFTRLGI